jgi:hypothetical protein
MKRPQPLDLTRDDIKALRDRAKRGELSVSAEDAALIESLAETVVVWSEAVERKGTSLRRLLKLLFGSKTESRRRLFGKKHDDEPPPADPAGSGSSASGSQAKPRPKGWAQRRGRLQRRRTRVGEAPRVQGRRSVSGTLWRQAARARSRPSGACACAAAGHGDNLRM